MRRWRSPPSCYGSRRALGIRTRRTCCFFHPPWQRNDGESYPPWSRARGRARARRRPSAYPGGGAPPTHPGPPTPLYFHSCYGWRGRRPQRWHFLRRRDSIEPKAITVLFKKYTLQAHSHPRATLAASAALCVAMIFLRNTRSKFSAIIDGGPPSIIFRIFPSRPMLRKRAKLRTRDSIT